MRTHPGKTDCLVLDFAGNIALHGSVDNVNPPKPPRKRDEPGEAPQKECVECLMLISASARLCPFCQHVYEFAGPKIDEAASNLAIMGKNPPKIRRVKEVRYSIHKKPGKPDSMRVDYYTDKIVRPYSLWVCLFHDGNALTRARKWWLLNVHESGEFVLPETIDQAVEQARTARTPDWIQTDSTGDYPTIVKMGFDDVAASAG